MRTSTCGICVIFSALVTLASVTKSLASPETLFKVQGAKLLETGAEVDFSALAKDDTVKAFLIANVASMCGYTESGYQDLREIASRYDPKIVVLGAPCAQFGNQEYAQGDRILAFAESKGANFPLLERQDVNGDSASELFTFLKAESCKLEGADKDCGDVRWNFEFFLVDASTGKLVKRWRTGTRLLAPEVLQVLDATISSAKAERTKEL
ncbi:Glutathione peroxidase [Hondaea fermentalgiana]|uniref:Glutathione peroxidase n=1 Tax=Hondaea fermentalgiana TaxID=2315210 RepID=A0A2R5H272_9STRA|nr:Glutathione peroxidase [Hondaea fermentalgiana]|eukprot:GBG34941.1 Glutathione peroxidase [Hondaea fermentalgiana]